MLDPSTINKLLANPRIYKKDAIPEVIKEPKRTQKEIREINEIKEIVAEQRNREEELKPQLSPTDYILNIKSEIFTIFLDKQGNPPIIDNGAMVIVKCHNDHIHKLPTRDVIDGKKCPTCKNGSAFSRGMIKAIREEFNIILMIVDSFTESQNDKNNQIEYYNPAIKLRIIVLSLDRICNVTKSMRDSIEKTDYLTIRLYPKPKQSLITFLRSVLVEHKYIAAKSYKNIGLPFTESSFERYVNHIPLDINDVNIIDDSLMYFENC